MRLAPFLAVAGLLLTCPPALAEPPAPGITCEKLPGLLAGPFVPNAETARAVFLAVEPAMSPRRDLKRFPLVRVLDEGDSWSVFRTDDKPGISDPVELPEGGSAITMRSGSHQLGMKIDKCSGRIFDAALMR